MFLLLAALFELQTPANGETFPGGVDSWAEMSVRVRKSGSMFETLRHYNFGPNVVLDTFISYL